MSHDLVFNIRSASWSSIRQLDKHETDRDPNGTSAIDPLRSHLNRILLGPATQGEALEALFKSGVKRPAAQAESPFLQIVVGASPGYFRPNDPEAKGTWDDKRLKMFERQTMSWLRKEFGRDLLHVSFHGDEDTPHYHVLVAPTYDKKPRRPGRQKRNETEEEFEVRKLEAENGETVRTVGRSSHATISKLGSYERLRRSYASKLSLIGIGYGKERAPDAPAPKTTAQWVKEEGNRLAEERRQLADDRDQVIADARVEGFETGRVEGIKLGRAEAVEEVAALRATIDRIFSSIEKIKERVRKLLPDLKVVKIFNRLDGIEAEVDYVVGQLDAVSPLEETVPDTDGLSFG